MNTEYNTSYITDLKNFSINFEQGALNNFLNLCQQNSKQDLDKIFKRKKN